MFKIGDFSKLTSVSIRMLRYYNEVGLFKPNHIDDFTGYRYYSATQINKLNKIISLRDMGFNVAEIGQVLAETSEKKIQELLVKRHEIVKSLINDEEHKLKLISSAIKDFTKETINMKYNVELKSVPSYQVLSLREVVPSYYHEGELWQKMSEFIAEKGLVCGPISFAKYHDEGFKDEDVDIEIVMGVSKKGKDEKGFTYIDTEELGLVASVLVPGDYENIAPAFQYLAQWIEDQGYSLNGQSRQLPLKGSWNEEDVENYLNEIQIPIIKI